MTQKEQEEKAKRATNIVSESDREIMDANVDKESKDVSECEVEQHNVLINPDPHSLDRG